MRKMPMLLSVLFVVTLSLIATVGPAEAGVQSPVHWIDQVFRGSDPFYGTNVNAYESGSTAKVVFRLYNDYYVWPSYRTVNVSAVRVWFDWNQNYSVAYATPLQVGALQTQAFTISFTVPNTTTASNMYYHTWKIYVEHVNATTGTTKIVSKWTYNPSFPSTDYYFAVYSTDQADATALYEELNAKIASAPSFSSYEAQQFWSKTVTERNIGRDIYHQYGDFADAKTHYQAGLDNFDQAMTAETAYDEARDSLYIEGQEASIRSYNASAEATVTEANAAMIEANASATTADAILNQSYAWILFGIGFIIMGLAALVYAYKKPQAAA
jgi:hypothetical protein